MKKICIYLFIFVAFLSTSQLSYAKDISIELNDNTPSFQQVDNFFNTDDMLWAPGKKETKSLVISNKTNLTQYVIFSPINKDDPSLVSQAMHISIINTKHEELYSNSLFAFINQGEKLIDTIEPDTTETITFQIQMYDSAGNKYQNAYLHYDLGIDVMDPKEYVTPTPVPCIAKVPPPISQLTLGYINNNQILIEWSKEYQDEEKDSKIQDLVTGHSIMYASNDTFNPFIQRYVGKTNQFIADKLDLKTKRYYFKVKTINDCQEGKWSSVISAGFNPTLTPTHSIVVNKSNAVITPTSVQSPTPIIDSNSASSFDNISPIIKTENNTSTPSTYLGQIQGVKTNKCVKIWWQILLIQLISVIIIMFGKHQFKKTKTSFASLVSLLCYIVFLVINPCLSTKFVFIVINETWFLNYFWMLDFFIFLQIYLFYKWWIRQDSNTVKS